MAGLLSLRLERVSAMWSARYHVTEEASRFILSSRIDRFGFGSGRQTWVAERQDGIYAVGYRDRVPPPRFDTARASSQPRRMLGG
jgi:hypothetical protein